jgi:hypothetical protein
MTFEATSGPILPLLILGVTLLHVGAFLIRWAWFGRRVGNAPHCRRCGYALTGLAADRCPECGTFLSAATTVRGQRVGRRGWALLGAACVVLGLGCAAAGVSPRVRAVDWYGFKPAGWVIDDVESSDGELAARAWAELGRRRASGGLSDGQLRDLDAAAVRVVSKGGGGPVGLFEYVAGRLASLTPEQRGAVLGRLIADAGSNSYMASVGATTILDQLIGEARLTPAEHGRITAAALGAQAPAAPASPGTGWFVNYLGDRALRIGGLTPVERGTFFRQAITVSLRARPTMLAGETEPYWVDYGGRGPGGGPWYSRVRSVSVQVDDGPARPLGGARSGRGFVGGGGSGGAVEVAEPGKHTLRVVVAVDVFDRDVGPEPDAKPHWSREVTLTAPFEALPADTNDFVRLIDESKQAAEIRRCLSVKQARVGGRYSPLSARVDLDRLPVEVAFDVFARHGGEEYRVGQVYANRGGRGDFLLNAEKFPPGRAATAVDFVFRSNVKIAKGTVDLYQIWAGEVVLENVPLKPAD